MERPCQCIIAHSRIPLDLLVKHKCFSSLSIWAQSFFPKPPPRCSGIVFIESNLFKSHWSIEHYSRLHLFLKHKLYRSLSFFLIDQIPVFLLNQSSKSTVPGAHPVTTLNGLILCSLSVGWPRASTGGRSRSTAHSAECFSSRAP